MESTLARLLEPPDAEPDRAKADTVVTDRDGIEDDELPDGTEIDDLYRNIRAGRDGVWRTAGEAVGIVEAGGNGLDEVSLDYVEGVQAERDGVIDSDIGAARYIAAGRTGAIDSTIDDARVIETDGDGLVDTEVGTVTRMITGGDGLVRSIVDEIDHLYSERNAVTDGSIIEEAGTVQAEGNAVTNAEIGTVETLEAEGYGVAGDAQVEEIGELRASAGVVHGRVGEIRRLDVTDCGLSDATADTIHEITTDRRMAEDSEIEEIGVAEAEFYEDEDDTETVGFKNCEIGSIGSLKVATHAIEDSEVGAIGDLDAVWYGINRSTVDRVDGDITVENYPIYRSVVGEVHGDIETDLDAVVDSTVDAIYGDVLAGQALFKESELGLVVGDSVTAKELDDGSYGNLVVADTVRTDAVSDATTVITPQDDRFTDYDGDIDALKDALEQDPELAWPIQVFQPDLGESTNLDEFRATSRELAPLLDDLSRDEVQDSYRDVTDYRFLEPEDFAQVLERYSDEFENARMENVQRFGSYLGKMDEDARQRLTDLLGGDAGQALYRVARGDHFLDRVDDPAQRLEDLATAEGDTDYSIDPFLEESPYREAFEDALDRHQDLLRDVSAMAARTGKELSLDIEQRVKQWEGQRRAGNGREIDRDELAKEIGKELRSKKQSYTVEALQELGREEAEQAYRKAFGPDTMDGATDQAALDIHDGFIFNRDAVEQVIDGDVYDLEANQAWFEETGLDRDLVTSGLGERTYELDEVAWQDGELHRADGDYTAWVASPEETLRMGDYFTDSCFATDKLRGWHAAGTAADANKQVVYLANENDSVVARQMVAFTEDGDLSTYSTYTNTDAPVEGALESYIQDWSNELGVDVVENEKDVELLEAERWHSRAL